MRFTDYQAQRPTEPPDVEQVQREPEPPASGQVLIGICMSVDPYMRGGEKTLFMLRLIS